ncbi:hypothetical protein SscP1EGY_19 [Streptomyces phage SscP1EGY]|nr:hypothetical protein SscP1EGY_19 [Streptomyces phage SscP1EGY]
MARLPHVVMPLSHDGSVVGTVDINWTGSFSGEIKIEELHRNLVELIKIGKIKSIGIHFEIEKGEQWLTRDTAITYPEP